MSDFVSMIAFFGERSTLLESPTTESNMTDTTVTLDGVSGVTLVEVAAAISCDIEAEARATYKVEKARIERPRAIKEEMIVDDLRDVLVEIHQAGETGLYSYSVRGGYASSNKWTQRADVYDIIFALDINDEVEVRLWTAGMGHAAKLNQKCQVLLGPTGRVVASW